MDENSRDENPIDVNSDVHPDILIFYAYRYSAEMGKAAEAVLKGKPTKAELKQLYRLVKRSAGNHFSYDVYMALIEAVRRANDNKLFDADDSV